MEFNKNRMLRLSGLLRESVEEASSCDECGGSMYEGGTCECGGSMYEKADKDESKDKVEESDETVEKVKENVAEMHVRRKVRAQLEEMWASGQVFGKKAPHRNGVTMGFKGIGFK
jgi:hypothetical protein